MGEKADFNKEKWRNLTMLSIVVLLGMSLWFSASAVMTQITNEWHLTDAQQSWLTISVQIGFVVGALLSSVTNLADRYSPVRLIAISALLGMIFNGAIALVSKDPNSVFIFRFLTGVTLAGVYPPGMKVVATWTKRDRGLGIGILVGALTVGSAIPHLVNAITGSAGGELPDWRTIVLITSGLAGLSSILAYFFIKVGPHLKKSSGFNWRFATQSLLHKPSRLANFGYLGHMWELYAMWAWAPVLLVESYSRAGYALQAARLAGFGVVAIGLVGSVVAGKFADRIGRTKVTIVSLSISGLCAIVVGFFIAQPIVLTIIMLIWGLFVVADSAQFSAAVSELSDERYIGTSLTMQTSMGFLLTLFTIRIIPPLVTWIGWQYAFTVLAIGPIFGIVSMAKLRKLPEAKQMASGNR